jgi:hypothetical protein
MGEAKRRKLGKKNSFQLLEKRFCRDGVDTSKMGFYDSPSFLKVEQNKPEYLHEYAKWVLNRPLDPVYEDRAKVIVPFIANLIANVLREDGFEGGCITATGILTRVFDRLGVWSFGLAGSAVFEVPSANILRGLHSVDHQDFFGASLGHSWVSAPPFAIVDASLRMQNWGKDTITAFLPSFVCEPNAQVTRPRVEDVISLSKREEYKLADGFVDSNLLNRLEPTLKAFGSDFPACRITEGRLTVRYIPLAIRMTDVPLFEINGEGKVGRSGREIWEQVIVPELPILESVLGEKFKLD